VTDRLRLRRVIVGVLAWVLFGVSWSLALRHGDDGMADGAAVLLLSALTALVVTLGWQRHNRSIYRRRGARQSRGLDRREWKHDRLGHRLDFQDGLGVALEVVVGLKADVKTYRAAP
jgi:hypothetical protein